MPVDLKRLTRAAEWWDYKLIPIITIYYCTIFIFREPIVFHAVPALLLLLAMTVAAIFVSLLNDVTDLADDAVAGKPNNMAGKTLATQLLLLAPTLAAGAFFLFVWRDDRLLVASYLAVWIAFVFYSVSPPRLKRRGLWGIVADACGAHLFPALAAVLVAFQAMDRPVDWQWLVAVLCWSLGYGLRGILWHQRLDRSNDEVAGVRTYAVVHPEAAARMGAWLAFPLECLALTALLWRLGHPLPVLMMLVYLLLVVARVNQGALQVTLTSTVPGYHILMQEYYNCYFPLAVLTASALRFPLDSAVIAAHVVLFPGRIIQALAGVWILFGRPGRQWIQRR